MPISGDVVDYEPDAANGDDENIHCQRVEMYVLVHAEQCKHGRTIALGSHWVVKAVIVGTMCVDDFLHMNRSAVSALAETCGLLRRTIAIILNITSKSYYGSYSVSQIAAQRIPRQ